MNVEESVICEFEMDFKKSFCFRFNLSNDDYIISSITGKYCSVAFAWIVTHQNLIQSLKGKKTTYTAL